MHLPKLKEVQPNKAVLMVHHQTADIKYLCSRSLLLGISHLKTQNKLCCFPCSIKQDILPTPLQSSTLPVTHSTVQCLKCPVPDGVCLLLAHTAKFHIQLGGTNSYSASKWIWSNSYHYLRDLGHILPGLQIGQTQDVGL